MNTHNRDHITYLEDMHTSMERVIEYIADHSFNTFRNDQKTVDAVIRNFEIIGEDSKNVPDHLKEKYQTLPWEEMYRLRNKASHEYFGIDFEIIWDIANHHLPKNLRTLESILEKEK